MLNVVIVFSRINLGVFYVYVNIFSNVESLQLKEVLDDCINK